MILLEGSLDVVLGQERKTIGPGDTVLAPAGTVHGFLNRYGGPARLLFVFQPMTWNECLPADRGRR